MKAYKLFRVRKDGTIGSLFINRSQAIPLNKELIAVSYPTKGYAVRKGWHSCAKPFAPHLAMNGRRWYVIDIRGEYQVFPRPKSQGGKWFISQRIVVLRPL